MSTKREEQILVETLGLFQNDKLARHSRTREHWREWGEDQFYFNRMQEEITELTNAIDKGLSPYDVWREAADIANFAAMLADRYEQRAARAEALEAMIARA